MTLKVGMQHLVLKYYQVYSNDDPGLTLTYLTARSNLILYAFVLEKVNPSHAAIKISINATAAEFICKNIFPTPVQVKQIIKNKIGDIQQIYLYQNVCK